MCTSVFVGGYPLCLGNCVVKSKRPNSNLYILPTNMAYSPLSGRQLVRSSNGPVCTRSNSPFGSQGFPSCRGNPWIRPNPAGGRAARLWALSATPGAPDMDQPKGVGTCCELGAPNPVSQVTNGTLWKLKGVPNPNITREFGKRWHTVFRSE